VRRAAGQVLAWVHDLEQTLLLQATQYRSVITYTERVAAFPQCNRSWRGFLANSHGVVTVCSGIKSRVRRIGITRHDGCASQQRAQASAPWSDGQAPGRLARVACCDSLRPSGTQAGERCTDEFPAPP